MGWQSWLGTTSTPDVPQQREPEEIQTHSLVPSTTVPGENQTLLLITRTTVHPKHHLLTLHRHTFRLVAGQHSILLAAIIARVLGCCHGYMALRCCHGEAHHVHTTHTNPSLALTRHNTSLHLAVQCTALWPSWEGTPNSRSHWNGKAAHLTVSEPHQIKLTTEYFHLQRCPLRNGTPVTKGNQTAWCLGLGQH